MALSQGWAKLSFRELISQFLVMCQALTTDAKLLQIKPRENRIQIADIMVFILENIM